ncbi:hypothetical protein OEZ85_010173 [Tetradesmus obliquus]|uniref:Uncharacterized protein n=1 Tax=Tetradesmus obliquus TaxID=3088 RepID=A0ABY8TQC9_TETOB|nr:hypothetical protein OEZ85_010173 [Tetradesmus obliquus]
MLAPSCSVRATGSVLAAPWQARPVQVSVGCRRRCSSFVRGSPEGSAEFEGVGGDRDLQDALVQQLRVQVESQALKDEIKEDLRERVEGLKQIGEELIQQLDEELVIEKFRTDLESTQVLSDANEKLNELEEQLQQIKDQIKADQEDLRAFEVASASARSQGLFFKNLYQPEQDPQQQQEQGEGAASSSSSSKRNRMLIDPVAARQAAAVVASSAEDEMASPFRMYLFGYMAAVLALVVLQDVATADPKFALDGLYAALGLLLGVNALNERRALNQVLADKQRQLQQLQQQEDTAAAGAAASGSSALGSSSVEQ